MDNQTVSAARGGHLSGTAANRTLEQELLELRGRLDHQARDLKRLTRAFARLIRRNDAFPVAPTFAEMIIDVLDLEVGAVLLPTEGGAPSFAVRGLPDGVSAEQLERALRSMNAATQGEIGVRLLRPDQLEALPGQILHEGVLCIITGRREQTRALLLGGNTRTRLEMVDTLTDGTLLMLGFVAEQCAAYLDQQADQRLIQEQLNTIRESEERLALVLEGTNDGWWDWDLSRGVCSYSARWAAMLGLPAQGASRAGAFWRERVHPDDRPAFDALLERALTLTEHAIDVELRLRCEDGSWLPVHVRGILCHDASGQPIRLAGSIQDLTERRRHEAYVNHLAFYDSLTELPNRRLLEDRLQQALLGQSRGREAVAVMMLDLDRFKTLNDTHGHATGDQLLQAVGRRLVQTVQEADTVARLGGDEYVVLVENLGADLDRATQIAEKVANRILSALNEPYILDCGLHHCTASIGLALTVNGGLSPGALLKQADLALYRSKEAGRNTVRLYQPEMEVRAASRSAFEAQLPAASPNDERAPEDQAEVDGPGRIIG